MSARLGAGATDAVKLPKEPLVPSVHAYVAPGAVHGVKAAFRGMVRPDAEAQAPRCRSSGVVTGLRLKGQQLG